MQSVLPGAQNPKLSFCIATRNRAALIAEMLESIICQATQECEIVVVDGASTDNTEETVLRYVTSFDRLRYFRLERNGGVDRDFDRAVELAGGDYCWLTCDDDLLLPGAVTAVLEAIRGNYSLIVTNASAAGTNDMSRILQERILQFTSDRIYPPQEIDRLFADTRAHLTWIGCVVIQRQLWLSRARDPYFGSMFIHLGVIFQARLPSDALVISAPLINNRRGNQHAWWDDAFEIFAIRLPAIISSLAISDRLKKQSQPSRSNFDLFVMRAWGAYDLSTYRRWVRPQLRSERERWAPFMIAVFPSLLANILCILYFAVARDRSASFNKDIILVELKSSPHYLRRWWSARTVRRVEGEATPTRRL